MKRFNLAPAVILAVLLAGCLVAFYSTRESRIAATSKKAAAGVQAGAQPPVDQRLLITAQDTAALAETADEQDHAREAMHLADQELDQAFATELRQAESYRPPAAGPLRDLIQHIDQLKTQIATEQTRVGELTSLAASKSTAADQLELAKAQLSLDQEELEDSQQDLARQGGDPHAALERALQEHETNHHQNARAARAVTPAPDGTLSEQVRTWIALGEYQDRLLAAEQQALTQASTLANRHNALEQQLTAPANGAAVQDTATRIAGLHRLSDQRKTLTELDKRIQDCQQLAGVYKLWSGVVDAHRSAALHRLLGSLALILGIILATLLATRAVRRGFATDSKRLHQMRIMAGVGLQVLGAVLILLIVFGRPSQISTIIGLATAGLTVVLKDFIVAFFGWFALMGKNGIRVGDWVEIEGVGGEVIEISVLKTVLLELGNWTNTGHPTGRQVAFSNSFALERHYFNFSTSGQWLWDELQVTVPATGDPYQISQEIRRLVERETEADAAEAARDWERVTSQYGARAFSATPAVDLRPTINGLEVVVRYITRAPQRGVVKSRLFQLIVDLLHKPAPLPDSRGSESPNTAPLAF